MKQDDNPDDPTKDAEAKTGANVVKLDKAAQALIGQTLKAAYGEIVKEPIPPHLMKLLDELERKERLSAKPDNS